MRIAHLLSVCGLAVLIAACVPATSAVAGDSDSDQAGSSQRIMLDPDTGDITQVPSQSNKDPAAAAVGASRAGQKSSGHTASATEDGHQTSVTEPSSSARQRVVRCPDGSLRMGHPEPSDDHGSDTANKLCDGQ